MKSKDTIIETDNADVETAREGAEDHTALYKGRVIIISALIAVGILILSMIVLFFTAEARLSLIGDEEIAVPVFETYSDEGARASFLGSDISDRIKTETDVDPDTLGEYKVKYSLDFKGKHYEAVRSVTVIDSEAPKITLEGDEKMILSSMSLYKEEGVSAFDNCDGDLTDKIKTVITEGPERCTVLYTVSDSSGNSAECRREIVIKDIVPPVLTLAGDAQMSVGTPTFTDPGYSATDDLDGDITSRVTVSSDYIPLTEGTFTFEYSVSDSAGNIATAKRAVTVADTEAPVVTLCGSEKVYLSEGDSYNEAGASASDVFDGDITSSVTRTGELNTSAAGVYTLTYSASDKKGNRASASRTVTVFPKPESTGVVNGGGVVSASTIYLTFDDGPSDRVTPQVLDILKANNIKATFFIINYSDANKAIISRIISEGHTVAIHGSSHDYAAIYASPDVFVENVISLQNRIYDDFGYTTNIIRFPGGSSNNVSKKYCPGIMSTLAPLMESLGYTYFDWNISSGDADGGYVSASAIANNVTSALKNGRGNVVLMHDTNAKETTAAALQSIIDYGTANGYTFAALSSDTTPVHHNINN